MKAIPWVIWSEQGCKMRVQHGSLDDARREAERLAEKHPGNRFFVLSAQGYAVTAKPTTWVDLEVESPF